MNGEQIEPIEELEEYEESEGEVVLRGERENFISEWLNHGINYQQLELGNII